jgi:hypothetical protein
VASGPNSGFDLTYDSSSNVVKVNGTLSFQSTSGNAELTLNLNAGLNGLEGSAKIVDSTAGVSRSVSGLAAGFTADDLGNVGGSITSGGNTITFQTTSRSLPPGTDAALEALMEANDDFCAEAQQTLAGLDPTEVPVASINNLHQSPRSAFTASKSDADPLTTQSWFDSVDVQTPGGAHVTISRNISCKTREAEHLASLGYNAAEGASCADLNARSLALAMDELSPAEQAAVIVPSLGPDVVRTTGSDWTTPLSKATEFNGTTLRGHALLTRWNDPAFQIFPDNIRGVHYCTIWSPAYAYIHLLTTLP